MVIDMIWRGLCVSLILGFLCSALDKGATSETSLQSK